MQLFPKTFTLYKYKGDLLYPLRATKVKLAGDRVPAGIALVTPDLRQNHQQHILEQCNMPSCGRRDLTSYALLCSVSWEPYIDTIDLQFMLFVKYMEIIIL